DGRAGHRCDRGPDPADDLHPRPRRRPQHGVERQHQPGLEPLEGAAPAAAGGAATVKLRTIAVIVSVAVVASAIAAVVFAQAPHASTQRHALETAPASSALPGPETVALPAAPHVRARGAILVDLATDRVLFAKHAGQRRPIASLAKIMTALLVLQRSSLSDVVRVGKAATKTEPINVGLAKGERITVRNLTYGLLLWSGNDTAVALAQHVSGPVRACVSTRNAKAVALGPAHTRFRSPNGLDDRGYSTAADVAELTRDALADPLFATFVATRRHRIPGP